MTAHLSSDRIASYLARTLSPAELLSIHEHIAGCQQCQDVLEQAKPGAEPHLTQEEMAALAARRLPEPRQSDAQRHAAECEFCRESLTAMESIRDRPGAIRARRQQLVATAIAACVLLAAVVYYGVANRKAAPAVLASLRDSGQEIQLDSSGALRGLDDAPSGEQSLVKDTLRTGSLPSTPAAFQEAPGVLRAPGIGASGAFSPIAPLQTRVLSDRPVFTWHPYPGASAYQVAVTAEALDSLERSGQITDTQWRPDKPLPRGVPLLWQVRAWRGNDMVSAPAPPAPPARFEILGAELAGRLDQLRASPRPSHLLAAVLLAHAGARQEADDELQALASENPGSKLLGSLRSGMAR